MTVCAVLPHEHNYEHRPLKVNGVDVPYWRALTGYVAPFSVTGNPVVTMPLCVIDGRPCGIQVLPKLIDSCVLACTGESIRTRTMWFHI